MDYTIVAMPKRTVAGISVRTSNTDEDMPDKIGGLWQRFFRDGVYESIPNKAASTTIGLYHNYQSDFSGDYDLKVCCAISKDSVLPDGVEATVIPAGRYAKFVLPGGSVEAVGQFWNQLWQMDLDRAYSFDYEEYFSQEGNQAKDIHIYISLQEDDTMNNQKQPVFCQSCGMPLTDPSVLGTNADQSKNEDYCMYCYKDGNFTADCTMEEMIEFCVPMCSKGNPYPDEETARSQMKAFFPKLKRWNQG
jgi:predicted transcriptional regulator YdeE